MYTDLVGTRSGLTWDQIKELSENGFDIQNHTKTHRNLIEMEPRETFEQYFRAIEKEIISSEQLIEQKLNKKCTYLAYPFGDTNNLIIALLKKYEYRGAFTVHRGGNPFFKNNYMVNRSTIYGEYSLNKFQKNLKMFRETKFKMRKLLLLVCGSFCVILLCSGCASMIANQTKGKGSAIAQYQKSALEYEKSGDLPMAVLSWKIVAGMDPQNNEAVLRVKSLQEEITSKADKHFDSGVKYYKKKSVQKARVQFLKTLIYNPDHTEALDYLKNRLPGVYEMTYTVQKKDTLKKIATDMYKDPQKDFLIAYINTLNIDSPLIPGTTLELPVFYEKTTRKVHDTEIELVQARKLLKAKKYERVLNLVEKTLEYDPVNPDATELANVSYYELGKELQAQKKYQESLKMYKNADSRI